MKLPAPGAECRNMSTKKQIAAKGTYITGNKPSEYSNIVPYPVLLILGDAFSDPCDVTYFLQEVSN